MPTLPWKRSAARKLWRTAKAKHNKALTAKQIKFKKDLGPRLDKLDVLLAKKQSTANDRALLKLAIEIKGIVKEYRLSLKPLGGAPQRELEAVLKKVFAEAHTIEKPKKKTVVKPSRGTEGSSGTSGPGVKVGTGRVVPPTTSRAKSTPTTKTTKTTKTTQTPQSTTSRTKASQTSDTDEMVESLPEQKVPKQQPRKRVRGERLVPNDGGEMQVAPDTNEQTEQETQETVTPPTRRTRRDTFGTTQPTRRRTESGPQEQEEEAPLVQPRPRAGTFGQTGQDDDDELTGLSEQDEPTTTTFKAPLRDQNTIETTESEDEEPNLVAEDGSPPVTINSEDGQTEREDEQTPG